MFRFTKYRISFLIALLFIISQIMISSVFANDISDSVAQLTSVFDDGGQQTGCLIINQFPKDVNLQDVDSIPVINDLDLTYIKPYFYIGITAYGTGATSYEKKIDNIDIEERTKLALGNGTTPRMHNIRVRPKNITTGEYGKWAEINAKIFLYGDVNRDGVINQTDSTMCMEYFMEMIEFDSEQCILGDVNEDGVINQSDSVSISRYIVGSDDTAHVGEFKILTTKYKSGTSKNKYGDVNRDGVIDQTDSTMCMEYFMDMTTFDSEQCVLGDVNGDGEVDNNDAILISKYAEGTINVFPVGEKVIFFSE